VVQSTDYKQPFSTGASKPNPPMPLGEEILGGLISEKCVNSILPLSSIVPRFSFVKSKNLEVIEENKEAIIQISFVTMVILVHNRSLWQEISIAQRTIQHIL